MARALRVLLVVGVVALVILAGAATYVFIVSQGMLRKQYPAGPLDVRIPVDSPSIARGGHLVQVIGACRECHDADMGGKIVADMGPVGIVAAPNLTRGRGGIGSSFTDADWVRALRYGLRPDATTLVMMPSEVYTRMSDEDLGAVIGYLKQLPPVDRELPDIHFGLLGRALLATGRLDILTAPKTYHEHAPATPTPGATVEYGRYLADVSGCHGCHGIGLSGGRVAGPPDLPPAANLTPAGLRSWTEADFVRAMREGRRPDGTDINEFMPWRSYTGMSDLELRALWMYLRSVPPKASGGK
jgi:cytochrome c553